MMTQDSPLSGEAERLLNHPLMIQILQEIEHDALNSAVYADTENSRLEAVLGVRAVRTVRQKLQARARAKTPVSPPAWKVNAFRA